MISFCCMTLWVPLYFMVRIMRSAELSSAVLNTMTGIYLSGVQVVRCEWAVFIGHCNTPSAG